MSKLYREPVQVQEDTGGRPVAFRWRKWWYQVESVAWVRPSLFKPWEPERWQVITRGGGVFELTRDEKGWVLWRVWD